jgi:hypothetical protein
MAVCHVWEHGCQNSIIYKLILLEYSLMIVSAAASERLLMPHFEYCD